MSTLERHNADVETMCTHLVGALDITNHDRRTRNGVEAVLNLGEC